MARSAMLSVLVSVIGMAGCNAVVPCAELSAEGYAELYEQVKTTVSMMQDRGMTEEQFRAYLDPRACMGEAPEYTEYGLIDCACKLSLYRAAADEMW